MFNVYSQAFVLSMPSLMKNIEDWTADNLLNKATAPFVLVEAIHVYIYFIIVRQRKT